MKTQTDTEIVIFRKFRQSGDVIALFPATQATYHGLCQSYMHIGQHSPADYRRLLAVTSLATAEEYAPLLEELKRIGYDNLTIRTRYTPTRKG